VHRNANNNASTNDRKLRRNFGLVKMVTVSTDIVWDLYVIFEIMCLNNIRR